MKPSTIILWVLTALFVISSAIYVSGIISTKNAPLPQAESSTKNPKQLPELNGSATVTIGMGGEKKFKGISVQLLSIEQDSRCPIDVQCIWAGEVAMTFLVVSLPDEKAVSVKTDGTPVKVGNYQLTLLDVAPAKTSAEIAKKDYQATIKLEKILE